MTASKASEARGEARPGAPSVTVTCRERSNDWEISPWKAPAETPAESHAQWSQKGHGDLNSGAERDRPARRPPSRHYSPPSSSSSGFARHCSPYTAQVGLCTAQASESHLLAAHAME